MNVQSPVRDISAPPRLPARQKQSWLSRRSAWIAVALALLVASASYYFFGRSSDTGGTPIIATAMRGDVENLVTALGNLQPLTSVDVGAQVSGQLKTLSVQIGQDVQKGQILAEIDSAVMSAKVDADNAQLQNLQAQLAERQSQLALAEVQADRQTRLLKNGATSQDAYDLAQAALKSAQAQVKSVQAQINQSQSTLKADQATLGYSKIYAPMTGTVTAIPAKQGQTLNANQSTPTILTIADLSTMTVSTQVSEADVPKLRLGMDAYFTTLGSGAQRWTGKLRQILPTPAVVNNVVLYTALFDVANPTKQLMTQMTAQVFFVLSSAHDVITVPVAALQFGGTAAPQGVVPTGARAGRNGTGGRRGAPGGRANGGAPPDPAAAPRTRPAAVTVVKDDGSQETRSVLVGVTDRVNAEIISGLSEGEKVIAGIELPTSDDAGTAGRNGGPGRGPARGAVLFGG